MQFEDVPFDIPSKWNYISLDNVCIFKKGPFGSALTKDIFVKKSDDAVKVYEQKNAINKSATIGDYYITRKYFNEKMKGFRVEAGDIIVSCAGTIGETFVIPVNAEIGIINQALMKITLSEHINKDFFLLYFDYVLKEMAKDKSKGSAIKNIPPLDILKGMPFPLIPIEEQQRIVNKLETILPLIEDI